jgi:LL-diaminopimelate aminotransferase
LREAGFQLDTPMGTMYLWVALPTGIPSAPFARRALEGAGVVVLPGNAFGPAGEGYFRLALTVSAARLAEAVHRLGGILEQMRSGALAGTA